MRFAFQKPRLKFRLLAAEKWHLDGCYKNTCRIRENPVRLVFIAVGLFIFHCQQSRKRMYCSLAFSSIERCGTAYVPVFSAGATYGRTSKLNVAGAPLLPCFAIVIRHAGSGLSRKMTYFICFLIRYLLFDIYKSDIKRKPMKRHVVLA